MQQVQLRQPRRAEAAVMSPSPVEPPWDRMDAYLAAFAEGFRRRDQVRWACVYLQGLLSDAERKNVGTMARHVVLPPDLVVDDTAQALQNFVNQSPWNEVPVWRRLRALFRDELADRDGVFIVDELAFCKQGRHSVGVQRQYSSLFGRKTNCQVAVGLWHASRHGLFPLALRLYLPRAWVQSPARLDATVVPLEHRPPRDKSQIALDLLDEVRAEGWNATAVLGVAGSARDHSFRVGAAERGLTYLVEWTPELLAVDSEQIVALGDTVRVASNRVEEPRLPIWWSHRERLPAFRGVLLQELGLDHFEGRSWRGFHHHACLVALAYGFRLHESPDR